RRHTRFSRDWSSDVCSSDLFRNTFTIEFFPNIQSITFCIECKILIPILEVKPGMTVCVMGTPLRQILIATDNTNASEHMCKIIYCILAQPKPGTIELTNTKRRRIKIPDLSHIPVMESTQDRINHFLYRYAFV